jgi:hypothetical protein
VSAGSNDLFGTDLAGLKARFVAIIDHLRALGIPRIYLAMIIPRGLSGGQETLRTGMNAWIAACRTARTGSWTPTASCVESAPSPGITEYLLTASSPHPLRPGYQGMGAAAAAILPYYPPPAT